MGIQTHKRLGVLYEATWMPPTVSELKSLSPPLSPLSLLGELTTMEGTALNLLGKAHSSACIRVLFLLCLICYPSTAPEPGSVTLPEDRFCTV